MTQKATLKIVHPNLEVFVAEMMKAAVDGWELDPQSPPMQFGVLYEGTILKDENLIEPPKPTRTEILTNARAAKKAKAAAAVDAGPEQPADEDAPAELSDEVAQPAAEA